MLFAGESGTGKTMAAEVLADELQLDLYRIDLSAVVSKYIGETEKNLARVFDAAEDSGAILLFDEADALFGKRSEVKDSHDRYANIEVSYLLQRMEAYRGLAILTTNLKSALDTAFQRRLRFVVQLSLPGSGRARGDLARASFPPPRRPTGSTTSSWRGSRSPAGNIRNIALNAAFLAAEDGRAGGDGPSAARGPRRSGQARAAAQRRRDAGVGMKRIVLNIDRLVLRGFADGERDGFAEGLRAELVRLLAVPDAVRQLASQDGVSRLKIGAVRVGQGANPATAGMRAARGIARGIKK